MILAGDEFGRSQQGNNNAYAQDNPLSWVDWNIPEDGAALIEFVRRIIALRDAFPILRRSRFLTGEYNSDLDVRDVRWLTPAAVDMEPEQWQDGNARCLRHAYGWASAGDWHQAPLNGCNGAAGAERLPRCGEI